MERIALVTGGNRGIGLEVCRQLVDKGFTVYQGARNIADIPKLPGNVLPIELDVTDLDSIRKVVDTIKNNHKQLDVLINNAAISKSSKGVVEVSYDEFRTVMETNYFGSVKMIQAFYPLLKKGDNPCIINVSSRMGQWDSLEFGYAPYRQSKVALNALTVQLSNELARDNINVVAVCPGWVKTDMGGNGAEREVEEGADTIVWIASEKNVPTGKFYADRKVVSW